MRICRQRRQLLERFTANRDVRRFHRYRGATRRPVLGVCRRVREMIRCGTLQVVSDPVRKAAAVRRRAALASWLYGTPFAAPWNGAEPPRRRGGAIRRAARARPPTLPHVTATTPNAISTSASFAVRTKSASLPEIPAPFVLCCLQAEQSEAAADWAGRKDRLRPAGAGKSDVAVARRSAA